VDGKPVTLKKGAQLKLKPWAYKIFAVTAGGPEGS
jgi:hypothetical protein